MNGWLLTASMLAAIGWGLFLIVSAGYSNLAAENRRLRQRNAHLLYDLDDAVQVAAGKDVTISQQAATIARQKRTIAEHEATVTMLVGEVGPLGPTDVLARWEADRALSGWSE